MIGQAPGLVMAGLVLTMTIGWGTTYYVPTIFAVPIQRDVGLSPEAVFAGVTVMLLLAAVVAAPAGRYMQRNGARLPLCIGSILTAAALALLSQAQGFWSYLLPWVLIGIATPLSLTQAALSAIAERAANPARAVSALLLLSGFSSTIFWPLGTAMEEIWGWRGTCLIFACLHIIVCLPVHAFVLRIGRAMATVDATPAERRESAVLPAAKERPALVLMALTLSLAGFVSWGLPLQLVEVLTAFGHPLETAVWIAALMGPAQVFARVGEMLFEHRAGVMNIGLACAALLPAVVMIPLLMDHSVASGVLFVAGYGLAAGAMTIVRSVMPLALFGRKRYARLLGLLGMPQNIAFAFSPLIFAAVMSSRGPDAVLVMSVAVGLLALFAMITLTTLVRRSASG